MLPLRRLRAAASRALGDAPVVFFAVVIGVALTFRVAIGWARAATGDEPSAGATAAAATARGARSATAAPTATIAVTHEPPPGGAPAPTAGGRVGTLGPATTTPAAATEATALPPARFARPAPRRAPRTDPTHRPR